MLDRPQKSTLAESLLRTRYDNFIGGEWRPPAKGRIHRQEPDRWRKLCEVARSDAEDVERALDAAHAAGPPGAAPRRPSGRMLNTIADRIEENLELLAHVETRDNGKPIRETRNADVPLAADHFRYFAGCIRAEEGSIGEIDHDTVAYHFREPMGVVGQIIPWNFPLLMASWKMAPACRGKLRRDQARIRHADESCGPDGPDRRSAAARVCSTWCSAMVRRSARRSRAARASRRSPSPVKRRPADRSCNTPPRPSFPRRWSWGASRPTSSSPMSWQEDDAFLDKALEGFALFAFNKGEVCTCPSRALVQKSIFDKFMEKAVARVGKIKVGDPLDPTTRDGRAMRRTGSSRRS